jgi:hypothetical protein
MINLSHCNFLKLCYNSSRELIISLGEFYEEDFFYNKLNYFSYDN